MPRHPFRFELRIDVIQRLKAFHFAGDPTLKRTGVELGDWSNATSSGHERIPERLETDPIRREHAHSGDYDTITSVHGLHLGIRFGGTSGHSSDYAKSSHYIFI